MVVDTNTRWKRCGNTTFYRTGKSPSYVFADVVNLSTVTVGLGEKGQFDEGALIAVFRKAPFYDWMALRRGVESLLPNMDKQLELMGILHGFMRYRKHTLAHATDEEVFDIFEHEHTDYGKTRMLGGVIALMEGLEAFHEEDPQIYPSTLQKVAIAVLQGSPAERNRGRIQEYFSVPTSLAIVEDMGQGLDEALAKLGITEC